jgi:hypothetical protein
LLGLELALEIGCNRLVAESDSFETIEACTGETRWWNESSAIFAECVDMIPFIGTISFKFCLREANQVVHEIARFCFSTNVSCNWVYEPPSFIFDSLINDVTVL